MQQRDGTVDDPEDDVWLNRPVTPSPFLQRAFSAMLEASCRHAPPVVHSAKHGEHCLYYGVEGEHLAETIVSAIENRPQLEKMAQAARKHSLAHHTYKALAKHIIRNTLELQAENEKPAHPREGTSQNVGP